MTVATKRCSRCHEDLPLDRFSRSSTSRDGHQHRCKGCDALVSKAWRDRNPDYASRKGKERYAAVGRLENADRYQRSRPANLARRDAQLRSVRGRLYGLFKVAQDRCRKSGLEFDLSLDWVAELFEKQGGKCAVTGIPFSIERNAPGLRFQQPFNPSLDRVDCDRGYVPDNVRLVCVMVNLALNRFGDDAFDRMCRAYVECHQ